MSEVNNHSDLLANLNKQHMSDLFEEMGNQHQFVDTDAHLKILFSAYDGFYSLYKDCLSRSKKIMSNKYFYNHAHKAMVMSKLVQRSLQCSTSEWVDCGFMDGFTSRLICAVIKKNRPDFRGEGFHFLHAPRFEQNILDHDMMITFDVEKNQLANSHGDHQEIALLKTKGITKLEMDDKFWDEYPMAKSYVSAVDQFEENCPAKKFSFVHISVSNFNYADSLLRFFYPNLDDKGIIMLNNHGDPYFPGPRTAWDRYFNEQQIPYAIMDCGSAVIIKN